MIDAVELLKKIISEHNPEDIWASSPFIRYRALGNTTKGEIGEEFISRYLGYSDFSIGRASRISEIDLVIEGQSTEVKTASLGANGTFQFNHIRLDRAYDLLLCLEICPDQIVFNVWDKEEVNNGEASRLVMMAQGQDVTYKLIKKLDGMRPVGEMTNVLRSKMD
ncbi:MAG: hypothetical protein F4X21_08940 [Acidimicrobiia bacterium]|nr:hypothetical protein [Acidimicrobiia bacterium]